MRCVDLDGDLLMLAHGDLRGWRAARARLHLALCPDCRRRFQRLGALSVSLATALRNPTLGARSLARPFLPWGTVGFVVVSFLVLGLLASLQTVVARAATPAAAPVESCAKDHAVAAPLPPQGFCRAKPNLSGAKRD